MITNTGVMNISVDNSTARKTSLTSCCRKPAKARRLPRRWISTLCHIFWAYLTRRGGPFIQEEEEDSGKNFRVISSASFKLLCSVS